MPAPFYRAVSFAELADWRHAGKFRAGSGSCEGKHLAGSVADARRWGELLFGSGAFAVLRIEIPDDIAKQLVAWPRLDGIGPACFATIDQLASAVVKEVIDEP